MPPPATGNVYQRDGRTVARVRLGKGKRTAIPIAVALEPTEARLRADLIVALAARAARRRAPPDMVKRALRELGAAVDGAELADALDVATIVAEGKVSPTLLGGTTFADVATAWTSGALAKKYPDNVKPLRRGATAATYLRHLVPAIGTVPIASFTIDDAQRGMAALPATLAPSTRRAASGVIGRVVALAVFPMRLLPTDPLPKGWRPRVGPPRVRVVLRPAEEARLAACPRVPFHARVFYAFLAREGMRAEEAWALTYDDLDLAAGAVRLDENKTDDPRAWALDPGTVRALVAWRAYRTAKGVPCAAGEVVFVRASGKPGKCHTAACLRRHLLAAGIDRSELHAREGLRAPTRLHDMRGLFITVSLANDRTEVWTMDRTGHRSSAMIAAYRRPARHFAELRLGPLAPMDTAIPELGPYLPPPAGSGTASGAPTPPTTKARPKPAGKQARGHVLPVVLPGAGHGEPPPAEPHDPAVSPPRIVPDGAHLEPAVPDVVPDPADPVRAALAALYAAASAAALAGDAATAARLADAAQALQAPPARLPTEDRNVKPGNVVHLDRARARRG